MKIKIKTHLFDNIELSPEIRSLLWLQMSKKIDAVLDEFYVLLQDSVYKNLLENIDVEALKSRQKQHWQKIILHSVDDKYDARLRRMHENHQKIGLPNRHYITAYMYLLNKFEEAILRGSAGPKEAFKLISALHSIFADDIVRAIEVQCTTGE